VILTRCLQALNFRQNILEAVGAAHVDVFAALRPLLPGEECGGDGCSACGVPLLSQRIPQPHLTSELARRNLSGLSRMRSLYNAMSFQCLFPAKPTRWPFLAGACFLI
jgi:hypothetical protein